MNETHRTLSQIAKKRNCHSISPPIVSIGLHSSPRYRISIVPQSDKFLEGLVYPHFPLPTHSPKRLPQRRRLDPEQARTSPGKPSVVLSMALVAVIAPLDSTRYRVHWRVCATLDYSQTELEYFAAQGRARGQGGGEVIG